MPNPSVLATRATRKTTRFGERDAKCNAARRHAPSCMGATDGQSNWPNMQKTLGNQGFTSGEDRNRTFRCFPCSFEEFERWVNLSDPRNIAPNGQCLLYYGTVGAETSLDTSLGCRVVGATDWGSYFRAGSVIVFRSLDLMSAMIFSRSLPNCAASSRLILRISSLIGSVVIF